MIRRPTELAPDILEQLGQRIGSARSAKEILKVLQDAHFDLKPATAAVLTVVDSALRDGQAEFTLDGKHYLMLYKVTLLDGEGLEWQARLKVVSPNESIVAADSQLFDIGLSKGELASRMLQFQSVDDSVEVSGLILTNAKEEGKGWGLGMGLISNLMVQDVIRRKKFPQAKSFRVVISDSAYSQNRNDRQQWSGYVAKLLGYRELPEEEWDLDNPEYERVFRV